MLLNRKYAFITIPVLYLTAGLLWITLSDSLLFRLASTPGWIQDHHQQLGTYKGFFYVALTTVLLGVMIRASIKSLVSSRRDFKRLFAETPNPMWIYDRNTLKFLLVNDAACKAYGYTPQEFCALDLYAIRPAQEFSRLNLAIASLQSGLTASEKWQHQGKDGVPFYVNIFSHDSTYENKSCRIVTAINVNKEQLAEIERTNLRQALNTSALVSITDLRGVILQANEMFCEVSGYSESELIGQNHSIVNSGYHPPELWADMWRTVRKGKTWRSDIRNKAKDGSYYWVDSIINPVFNSDGKIYKLMSIRYLITERKQLEQEQQSLLKDLSQFAFQTSHELRGPVARMLGLISLFKDYPEKQLIVDKIGETSEEIDAVIRRMNEALDRNAYPILRKQEAFRLNNIRVSRKAG